ncbi:MAG: hypothetical protein WAX85_02730 [Minisyncoccia bacterium]
MKNGDTGFLRVGTKDRVTWIPVRVNVVHHDGTITFQQFGGIQTWFMNLSETKEFFYKKIPKDRA